VRGVVNHSGKALLMRSGEREKVLQDLPLALSYHNMRFPTAGLFNGSVCQVKANQKSACATSRLKQ
jgi:hypothetical protein